MDAKLQAGVEMALQKTADEQQDSTLSAAILRNAEGHGLAKDAAQTQGVAQEAKSGAGTPSSNKSEGMEDKNKEYGKGEVKLDDDPSKGKSAQSTGATVNNSAGAHITTEASGMPDLSLKNAGDRQAALKDIIQKHL